MSANQQAIYPSPSLQYTPIVSRSRADSQENYLAPLDDRSINRGWRNSLLNQIQEISSESQEMDWDGDGSLPVNQYAKLLAMRFVYCLPENIAPPEITVTPSGYFAFDWMKRKNYILSVEILEKNLIYACILGDRKEYGEFPFYDEISSSFDTLLTKYF